MTRTGAQRRRARRARAGRWSLTSTAAPLYALPVRTLTRWCEEGTVLAVKIGGRWYVELDALAQLFTPRTTGTTGTPGTPQRG